MISTDALVCNATTAIRRSGYLIAKTRRELHLRSFREIVRNSAEQIALARHALEQANAAIARTDGRRL